MRIAAFSMAPIFENHIHGGSQKILTAVLRYLGEAEHDVKVFCTQRADNDTPFQLTNGVEIFPTLRFKETYPEPHFTAPYNLADIILTLEDAKEWADVFYIHDAELLFHYIYDDIPTCVSFRDFVYPDTLVGAFGSMADKVLLNSHHTKSAVFATLGRARPGIKDRTTVIPNGIDTDVYSYKSGREKFDFVPSPEKDIILFPHRPDPKKGLVRAVTILAELTDADNSLDPVLLVPKWIDDRVDTSEGSHMGTYKMAEDHAAELGVSERLIFHHWIKSENMPYYYSVGDATLAIGTFIHSFPNAAVESEVTGTPSIVSRVGASRNVLPDDLFYLIEPKSPEAASAAVETAIKSQSPERITSIRRYVQTHHSWEEMLAAYEEEITSTVKRERFTVADDPHKDEFVLAPWCHISEKGVYNDYEYGFDADEDLLHTAEAVTSQPQRESALRVRLDSEVRLDEWMERGFFVPAWQSPVGESSHSS